MHIAKVIFFPFSSEKEKVWGNGRSEGTEWRVLIRTPELSHHTLSAGLHSTRRVFLSNCGNFYFYDLTDHSSVLNTDSSFLQMFQETLMKKVSKLLVAKGFNFFLLLLTIFKLSLKGFYAVF